MIRITNKKKRRVQANAQMNLPVFCMNDLTIGNSCVLISVDKDLSPYNKRCIFNNMKVIKL